MKKLITALLCVALVSTTIISATAESQSTLIPSIEPIVNEQLIPCEATVSDDYVTGEIMVGIKMAYSAVNKIWTAADFPELSGITSIEDLTYADTEQAVAKYNATENFRQLLKINIANTTKAAVIAGIDALEQNEKVYFAEPNAIIEIDNPLTTEEIGVALARSISNNHPDRYRENTNDPYLDYQHGIYLHNIDKVWNAFTTGSSDVVVGVIDSGVYNHSDLSANLLPSYNCIEGYAESYIDIHGHGTRVASIIGAKGNNNMGITGVCQNISLYPLRISDRIDGKATNDAITCAILKAHVQSVPIVNLSYGGRGYDATTEIAMGMYDGLIVCVAGNGIETESVGAEITESTPYYSPCYDADNVIVVGSINVNKQLSTFSNYSNTFVDVMAYGENHVACTITNSYTSGNEFDSGTSYASPMVAGVAALLLSYDSSLTTAQLKQYIMEGARTTSELEDYCVTGGYLDAYGAFLAMLEDQAYSYKVQIHQYEEAYEYGFTVTYYEDYEHLTEIIIPDAVQVCLMSLDISYEHNKIHVYMELAYLFELEDLPIMEFHFISFNESSVPQTYFSTSNHIVKDVHGSPIANAQIPSKTLLAGDANGDSVVNISDYLAILQHTVGNPSLTGDGLLAADVDGNFVAGSSDALLISNYITDKIYSFY